MTDIVERLRAWLGPKLLDEAADEIERLNGELGQVREILGDREADNERLRAAHQEIRELENNKIVSGEGLFMRTLLIARRALEPKP